MLARRSTDLAWRYLVKPVAFCSALVPLAGCIGGLLVVSGVGWARGFNLGVDPVRYVLDVLGKTALNLVLITLLVSPARQITGWSNLLRLRRMLGLFAFFYALVHFSVYIGLYESFSWSAILQDIAQRPYITIGFTALLMLLALAVTSTNKMMRRLGRRWQQLHRLIYLIAPLGILHYWKMLKLDWREPSVYAAILSVLLGWRVWRRWSNARARRSYAATSRSATPKAQERA